MKSKLEQLYEDQIIICKGLSLLEVYDDFDKFGELLTQEQKERLYKLNELEMAKLVKLEKEIDYGKNI